MFLRTPTGLQKETERQRTGSAGRLVRRASSEPTRSRLPPGRCCGWFGERQLQAL